MYFWNKTLHVSDSSSVHHQEFFTVHTTIHTGLLTACSQAVSKPVWHIPLLRVQWKTLDDGQRNCPKHVEFYSKNKFEKLVHLVGFIIERNHLSLFKYSLHASVVTGHYLAFSIITSTVGVPILPIRGLILSIRLSQTKSNSCCADTTNSRP